VKTTKLCVNLPVCEIFYAVYQKKKYLQILGAPSISKAPGLGAPSISKAPGLCTLSSVGRNATVLEEVEATI